VDWIVGGKPYNAKDPAHFAAVEAAQYPTREAAVADLTRKLAEYRKVKASWVPEAVASTEDAIARIKAGNLPDVKDVSGGKMYEVQIDADPERFLDSG